MLQVVLADFVKKNGEAELQFYTVTHTYPHTMHLSHNLPEGERIQKQQRLTTAPITGKTFYCFFPRWFMWSLETKMGNLCTIRVASRGLRSEQNNSEIIFGKWR
jgi:hypothetical protein